MLYWRYLSEEHKAAGALMPQPMRLRYGIQEASSPFRKWDEIEVDRAIHRGYRVRPADCPAIRNISRFGYVLRCPGEVRLERQQTYSLERDMRPGFARFGYAVLHGDSWPGSDSDLVANWLTGSEYVKIQTGIDILFPSDRQLYQGPLPNAELVERADLAVAAGLEYFNRSRSLSIDGQEYGIANMNVVVRLPELGVTQKIAAGEPIAWVFDLPRHSGEMQALNAACLQDRQGDA